MPAPLRPMNLGEILDRTFEIYRKRFLVFAGIAALPAAAMLAIHLADIAWVHTEHRLGFDSEDQGTRVVLGWFLAYGYYHISGFLWLLFQPVFVRAASEQVFGASHSIVGSLRFAAARWRSYLWLAFLKICAQLIVPEALAIGLLIGAAYLFGRLGMLNDSSSIGALAFGLMALLVVAFFRVGITLAFAMPAAALEEISGWKSLGRSRRLTRGSRWRILLAWIMALACALVLEAVAAFLAWRIALLVSTGHTAAGFNRPVYEATLYFLYAVAGAVVGPLYPIAVTLLYYDQRARREGYDVERMMEAAGLVAPAEVENSLPAGASAADSSPVPRVFPL